MRLLFVGKRHPQQRDLITRPFGRFHHLPARLRDRGHDVRVLLVNHRADNAIERREERMSWRALDARSLGPLTVLPALERDAREFAPDWIVGMSDAWYGWIAQRLARATGAGLCVDAYDNFESYMPWNLPLHLAWRRSIRHADLVTAAGPQLAAKLQSHRAGGRDVQVLPMAADPEFAPMNTAACRETLGLPQDRPLLGYVGSWSGNRGSRLLLDAFRIVRRTHPRAALVLSGHPPRDVVDEPGVIATGYVADDQVPALVGAVDVGCIVTADTAFGRYSYPVKLCEAMACGIPVVATATGPVSWMLGGREKHLSPPGDANTFADRVLDLLQAPDRDYGSRLDWAGVAASFDALLRDRAASASSVA